MINVILYSYEVKGNELVNVSWTNSKASTQRHFDFGENKIHVNKNKNKSK